MANQQMGPINTRWADSRKAVPNPGGGSTISSPANYASIDDMRARLKVIDPGHYTDSMLDVMSTNDMVYAIRMSDDADSITQ